MASSVLSELSDHLANVDQEPSTPLDVDLLEKCELFTNTSEYNSHTWRETRPLFFQLASLLPTLQQDPSPLVHLIIKLTAPYRFEDVKEVDFETALALEATPFHDLILSLLEKASSSSNDAQALANRPSVVTAIVRLWLCTNNAGVASKAADLLVALLRVSKNEPVAVQGDALHSYGNGPIWRRLFNDKDVYTLFYSYTTFAKTSAVVEPVLPKKDRTIAQARMLEWLPKVGNLDWSIITTSHGAEVEQAVGLSEGQGLLHYATLKMVDISDDILMHMTLINFFTDLITTVKTAPHLTHYDSSVSLDFLKEQGIHKQIIEFHTSDSPGLEQSFLGSRTAHYIAEYASHYPENFEVSVEMKTIRKFVHRNIRKCEASDLHILASMPRSTLIPRTPSGAFDWTDSPLLDIPVTRTNQDALKTLAAVFHGPPKEELTFPQPAAGGSNEKQRLIERVYARLLLALFYIKNSNFFAEVVRHADTIAMKDNALAALTLLSAIVTSDWEADIPADLLPSNDVVLSRLSQFPKTGIDVVLDPTISSSVLPYLLKPATTYSNLVGGRGDAENAAYQVATAKFGVLKALGRRLEQDGGRQDVIAMVRRRVAEGAWGVGGSAGSRIGTLDL
ncbi:hypothetical protein BDV96DRAFT_614593 [Lophiotrema nucula]|uniref:Uncharacterized protein n=1 Tax=Lophiotrema nucula TaxID=690887 RepID=A0A6A5YX55_9PLEO|nr:hypothetical protein BDV96DRAFT_614593 [Lophiotrema nucula]